MFVSEIIKILVENVKPIRYQRMAKSESCMGKDITNSAIDFVMVPDVTNIISDQW